MNKEPVGLYIFRFALGLGLFAFMCMLYWSSVLIEEDMQNIKNDIAGLKNDIFALRAETGKVREEVMRAIIRNQENWQQMIKDGRVEPSQPPDGREMSKSDRSKGRPHIDPSLPNLLSEDPFYEATLPLILGADFKPHGTFKDATIGKPDDLHPFSNWSEINTWNSMCGLSVARMKVGKYETFAPNMAIKVESRMRQDVNVPEYWVHLRKNVFWQPLTEAMFAGRVKLAPQFLRKHPVTAHDFKFFFDAVMNPHVQKPGAVALRNYIGGIEEIEVVDDLTFIVRWEPREVVEEGEVVQKIPYVSRLWTGALRPLPAFVYQYFSDGSKIINDDSDPDTYRTNSVWAQNFQEHWAKNIIVSCGRWIFEEMSERQVRFRRNPDHFFPLDCLGQSSLYTFKNSPDNVWQEFKANRLDNHTLNPDQLIELDQFLQSDIYKKQAEQGDAVKSLEYFNRAYLYIGWNMAKPWFKSTKVRQAMTMAIDRDRIIEQYLNGMGRQLTGPFSPFSAAYDRSIEPWPFDPLRARQLLEEDGWFDSDGDGIIDKAVNGKKVPFQFRLTYYVKNPTTKAICEYIATALKEVGVKCALNGVDLADLSAKFDDKSFDALCLGWGLGTPPEDPRQLWHSEGAKEPGSSNAVGFANPEVDEIIEKLAFEGDQKERVKLYHRFHEIIHEEQPYTFLYTPKTLLLYREYLKNVFIPKERQDLIPGADVAEPMESIFYLDNSQG